MLLITRSNYKYFLLIIYLFTIITGEEWNDIDLMPSLRYPPGNVPKNLRTNRNVNWFNVTQKLDHFNANNDQRWLMRSQYNDEHFKDNGPIFVMLGSEEPIPIKWLYSGQMFDMAKHHEAFIIVIEHRFYGYSRPTGYNLTVENLKYLTTEQALADAVNVIQKYKETFLMLNNSKVVVFGGSYAGNMALWMRAKYPEIVHAAVSSSAPLLAKADFYEYYETVQELLGPNCSKTITKAVDQISILLGTPEGLVQLQNDFNLCEPLDTNNPLDIMYFFSVISTYFGSLVQYATGNIIFETCARLLSIPACNEYTSLSVFLNQTFGPKCRKNYHSMKTFFSNPISNTNKRQWIYQTCTQYGYFQTTTSKNQPFRNSLPLTMYHSWCQDFFGPEFTPTVMENGIARTNLIYGGLEPTVTRVVSTQGTADPWFKLGLKERLNSLAPVIIINGSSHCEDLNSITEADSPQLKNGKLLVQSYIKKWLQED